MSGPVDLGQTFRYRHTVKNASGVLANAGTVTVTITKPDGTTANPSVVNSSTGVYDIAYLTTQAGLHNLFVDATGGVLGTEHDTEEDVFTVEATGRTFIGIDEASSHLRAAGTITSDNDREQLRWLCLTATDAVERDLGRAFSRRTITETYSGGYGAIILRSSPVLAITSVTESGTSLTSTDWVLDSASGILRRGSETSTLTWAWGRNNIDVTYVVGYTNPPRVARMVALNLVQALWQTSQQAPRPLLDESGGFAEEIPGILAGLPQPLRAAYNKLRSPGLA